MQYTYGILRKLTSLHLQQVKKALKSLDNPDKDLSEKDQIQQTRTCLIEIGQRIEECLNTYADSEQAKMWKR